MMHHVDCLNRRIATLFQKLFEKCRFIRLHDGRQYLKQQSQSLWQIKLNDSVHLLAHVAYMNGVYELRDLNKHGINQRSSIMTAKMTQMN